MIVRMCVSAKDAEMASALPERSEMMGICLMGMDAHLSAAQSSGAEMDGCNSRNNATIEIALPATVAQQVVALNTVGMVL